MECLVGDSSCKIPVGGWIASIFDFLKTYFDWFFDALKFGLTAAMQGLINGALSLPPLLIVAGFVLLAWLLHRSWKLCLGVGIGFWFILNQGSGKKRSRRWHWLSGPPPCRWPSACRSASPVRGGRISTRCCARCST